jgi:hypothetical protein
MGQYTGLRCKAKLKTEFIPVIQKLIETREWTNLGYEFLEQYALISKAGEIPFGALKYMPDEWETEEALKDWETRIEDGLWIFQCSLKDYDDTIQYFLINVLPKIADATRHLEVFCEKWDSSKMFELINGGIADSEKEGIPYSITKEVRIISENKTILMEQSDSLVVRIDTIEEIDGNKYRTWRHEIWMDRAKFEQGIPVEFIGDMQYIYCYGFAGLLEDESAIKIFKTRFKLK